MILYHPYPVTHESPPDLSYFDAHAPLSHDEAHDYLRTHQLFPTYSLHGGAMPGLVRRPFVGKIETFPYPEDASPDDPNVPVFGIKRVGTAENIARQNLSATVRFINQGDTDNYATERDFPIGDLKLETVLLALVDWNFTDDNNRPVQITRQTVQTYLQPDEFEYVYEKCLDVNPMWRNGGEEVKKS